MYAVQTQNSRTHGTYCNEISKMNFSKIEFM